MWCDLFDRAFNAQVWMRSNYTFHRLLGLALQQVFRKLDRRTANQKAGFWVYLATQNRIFPKNPVISRKSGRNSIPPLNPT
ncbi:hypothetical protein QUA81_04210 [Microcoleus sp. F6_B4]